MEHSGPQQSNKNNSEGILGSYKGQTLYERDLLTLEPCQWLNGSIIQFRNLMLENDLSPPNSDKQVRIMDPLVSALIVYCSESDITDTVEMTGIEYFDLVLLPINNNTDPQKKYSGNHWTFLMLFKQSDKLLAYHCCSVGRKIPESGELIVQRVAKYLNLPFEVQNLEVNSRQKNNFDCGLFSLFFLDLAV